MVATIVTIQLESGNAQSSKEPGYSRFVGSVPREEEFLLDDEVLGEVAMVEEVGE